MTGTSNIPLICYCNGELTDEDKNARYIGGQTKVGIIPTTTGFIELRKRVQEILKLSSDDMAFLIKCRFRVDDYTVIAIDIDDDQSVKFILDHSLVSNGIIAYIIRQPLSEMDTRPLRKSSCATEIHEPVQGALTDDYERRDVQEAKSKRRVGRPYKESIGVAQPSKGTDYRGHVELPYIDVNKRKRGRPLGYKSAIRTAGHCQKCRRLGHNIRTCIDAIDNDRHHSSDHSNRQQHSSDHSNGQQHSSDHSNRNQSSDHSNKLNNSDHELL